MRLFMIESTPLLRNNNDKIHPVREDGSRSNEATRIVMRINKRI